MAWLAIVLCPAAHAQKKSPAVNNEAVKTLAMADIQARYDEYKNTALQIWNFAEVGYKEVKSSALLQKTLLNVEGLGRQLDPYLDLWATAQPFLEKWMRDQVGPEAVWQRLLEQAPYLSSALPQVPRLIHQALEQRAAPTAPVVVHSATGWTNVWLAIIAFCMLAILGTLWIPLFLE